jgi:cold shock CspA family protein
MQGRGRIKSWDSAKGFGFIDRGPYLEDVFVHASVLPPALRQVGLAPNTAVRFDMVEDPHGRGYRAAEIVVCDEAWEPLSG